jgi:mono/diheme cytochrome c family protein
VRRVTLVAVALLGAVLLAGCGAQGVVSPMPQTVIGTLPKAAQKPITPAFHLKGDPGAGKGVFTKAGCGSCHTLAAAHSTGTVGPNLDQLKPDYRAVTGQVTLGGAAMPAFKSTLSSQEIANVAAFVVKSTGGTVP